jgi:Zn finger protein HypA/HybF involved in hydrogenase expression
MIPPKPYKLKCTKCGYTKIIKPKSDVLPSLDFITTCPKCRGKVVKCDLNLVDKIITNLSIK